jgi:kumamolisin
MAEGRIPIPGSEVRRRPDARPSDPADSDQRIKATIVLRRHADRIKGADPEELRQVVEFARGCGLQVLEESVPKRMVRVVGTVGELNAAFGISLRCFGSSASGGAYLSYEGPLTVPDRLAGCILAVLGLHQAPVARPR